MPSAKRPGGYDGQVSSKAPKNYKVNKPQHADKVIESLGSIPSAKKNDTIRCDVIDTKDLEPITILPSAYRDSLVKEEKPEPVERKVFKYQVPEGFTPRQVLNEEVKPQPKDYLADFEQDLKELKDTSYNSIDRLMKKLSKEFGISPRKLHNDFKAKHGVIPDEWVKKNSVHEEVTKSPMELLADKIAKMTEPRETPTEMTEEIYENKVFHLENQIHDLKKLVLEVAQGTIVHGLGHGSTGSGEVNLNRMDDVDVRNIQDGSTLIWDQELQKWIPSGSGQSQIPGGNQDIINKLNSLEQVIFSLQEFVQTHTHTGDGGTIDDGHTHGGTDTNVLTYEGATSRTGARTVDFENDTTAFIIAEESVDLDHFHTTLGDVFLIEVEGGTSFSVDDHADHEPSWVSMEVYTTYNVPTREVNWDASDGVLLLALEETSFYHADFSDSIIVELETSTITAQSQSAQVFGFEVQTNTDSAASFDWDDDVNLLSPEGVVNPADLSTAGDGTYLGLEDGVESQPVVNLNTTTSVSPGEFFDTTPGGDINRFRVTVNDSRNVYELDGIAQPAIQLPRGDIIEFDLIAIEERDEFVIYVNGEELSTGVTRYPTLLSLDTSKLPRTVNKAYYRHKTKRGMGWIIVIADN